MEVIVLIETEIPLLRVIIESQIPELEWTKARHKELVMLDESSLRALHDVKLYQAWILKAFNKKVELRDL